MFMKFLLVRCFPYQNYQLKKTCLRLPVRPRTQTGADDTYKAGREPAPCVEERKHKTFKIPKYHGQKVDCIRQVLSRDLEEGERNNSLFILYNLLLQNKNTEEYSKKLVIEKNGSLSNPLTGADNFQPFGILLKGFFIFFTEKEGFLI